jgi:predicted Zn-dependent protease with MMP-like domain
LIQTPALGTMPAMDPSRELTEKRFWQRLRAVAETEVKHLVNSLPPPIREKISDIPIVFQPVPSPEMERDGVDPDLMGLFTGEPLNSSCDDIVSPEIHIFIENIWEEAEHDPAEYREQVRITLLHELGHFLGLEEDGLSARDLE